MHCAAKCLGLVWSLRLVVRASDSMLQACSAEVTCHYKEASRIVGVHHKDSAGERTASRHAVHILKERTGLT